MLQLRNRYTGAGRGQRRVLLAVLGINVVTFIMMVTASYLSGSSALLSGALDNFGDAVTYALSFAVVGASGQAKAVLGTAMSKLNLLDATTNPPAPS